MNWVGGSRSRFMKNKEDTMKQRAFFQKQRMKAKCKHVDPQASPNGNNTGNMDLLTLFIVNQIASKKTHTGKPKMNFFNAKESKKAFDEPFELPMSPCSPSELNLVTSQPQYMMTAVDTPGFKVRKHQIAKEFKFKPLSPLLESNLSDVSGLENQPHILNTASSLPDPFSVQSRPASHASSSLPSQENPDGIKEYACSNEQVLHTQDALIKNHRFLSVNNSTSAPSQAPPCKQKIKKQTHDGNAEEDAPIMQDAGTQTAAVSHISCCDASVQCSLVHTDSINSTGVHTTRRQSVHFNEVPAGASAAKVQAKTQPKLAKGLSSRKSHRQTSMKKTPILRHPLRKGLELKVGQLMECRVNIERCED